MRVGMLVSLLLYCLKYDEEVADLTKNKHVKIIMSLVKSLTSTAIC